MARLVRFFAALATLSLFETEAQIRLRPSVQPKQWGPHRAHPSQEWAFQTPCDPDPQVYCALYRFTLQEDGILNMVSFWEYNAWPTQHTRVIYHHVSKDGHEQWNYTLCEMCGPATEARWAIGAGNTTIAMYNEVHEPEIRFVAFDIDGVKRWDDFTLAAQQLSTLDFPLVCEGGDVYIKSISGDVVVISATTGLFKFKASLGRPLSCGPDDTVFFEVRDDATQANVLVKTHGNLTEKWRVPLGPGTLETIEKNCVMVGPDGKLYGVMLMMQEDGTAFALDNAGKFLWMHKVPGHGCPAMLLDPDGTLYMSFNDAITTIGNNGSVLWNRSEDGLIASPNLGGAGGVLYTLSKCDDTSPDYHKICNVSMKTISQLGQVTREHHINNVTCDEQYQWVSPIAGKDNSVYFINQNVLARMNNDGYVEWNFTDGGSVWSASVAQDHVYVVTDKAAYSFKDASTLAVPDWV